MEKLKKTGLMIVVVLLLGYVFIDYFRSESQKIDLNKDMEVGLNIDNKAPDFEVTTLDGDVVKLSDYYGETIMLNFWASWCPPCRAEMPDMEKFHQDTEIKILAINMIESEKSSEDVDAFIEEFGLTFEVLLDHNNKGVGLYQVISIPTTYFINKEGVISYKSEGPMNYERMVHEYSIIK